jgi:hypothetical protein
MRHARALLVLLLAQGGAAASAPALAEVPLRFGDAPEHAYEEPFFAGTPYDPSIPTPTEIIGQEHATRLSHHAEIVAAFRAWAEASDRLTLGTYGRTHEGRELVYAVVTSPENHARIDEIRADLGRLHDPRGLASADAERIVGSSPAAAWMGYSIHGDEVSGADASVALGYHLVAGQSPEVEKLLDNVVVVIDPNMNPDGRERIIGMVEQAAGVTPNLDYASMHRGRWPYGRGNHYLFDMNRDWMAGTQPETRGRWRVARSFYPQLFVDAHEMGSLDTFLSYPQTTPINPNMPPKLIEWQRRYIEGTADAFDRYGWSYYTREWADAWAPIYSDSWGALIGGIGILYEQASTTGVAHRRPSGEILTYRESVHHQAVASLANLTTLSDNRELALADYLDNARRNVDEATPGNRRSFLVKPGLNLDRDDELVRILVSQGVEVFEADEAFSAANVVSSLNETAGSMQFPAGTLIVPAAQPLSQMVHAYLTFDVRMTAEDLKEEREEVERKGRSGMYDVSGWSLPHALDVDAYWGDAVGVARSAVSAPSPSQPAWQPAAAAEAPVAWAVSGANDSSVAFAARAMEAGLEVNISDTAFSFEVDGSVVELPAGSLLVRRVENEGDAAAIEAEVGWAAEEAGVRSVYRVGSGLTPGASFPDHPDLGGGHFSLLSRPRVAILANAPVSYDRYGHLWHHLDQLVGVPFTLLDAQWLGAYDLRRYNVIVLPPGRLDSLLEASKETLERWVAGGGTLIACAESAAALTSGRLGLSSVTLRRHALDDLTPYRLAAQREWASREIEIDEAAVWGEAVGDDTDGESDPYAAEKVPTARDEWLRRFSPWGVTLRGIVDPDAWIAHGVDGEMPVLFSGSSVFLSQGPVKTAVRLAEEPRLRLSGLVWPEARERIAESAWLTVERKGSGQIVLFAAMPAYRGYHRATARLFANAVVYGPGLGADQPISW